MLFNSAHFLWFFPLVLLCYYILPARFRKYWLLAASYYFYMCWNVKYIVLILFSTIVTYAGGLVLARLNAHGANDTSGADGIPCAHGTDGVNTYSAAITRKKRLVLGAVLGVNFAVLFLFKYFNFFFATLTTALGAIGLSIHAPTLNLLLPVGISFYTFQALSYTMDVFSGTIKAEKRFVNYALFVSFFPQLVAGPIERSGNLLHQMDTLSGFNYTHFTVGLRRMLFGFFQKVVIADRIAVVVNTVYNHPGEHAGFAVLVATVLFAFQIYCDFAGYSNIAMGCAGCMGVKLMKNFDAPYFSASIKEFWRRWHISLSTWFRDYLYIPLGGSRKGKARTYLNILLVFFASGLWHGASITFVVWGLLHGLYQVIATLLAPLKAALYTRLHISGKGKVHHVLSVVITFALVDFAWIFFRANSFADSIMIIKSLFSLKDYRGDAFSLVALGLDKTQLLIAGFSLFILAAISLISKKYSLEKVLQKLALPVRWGVYLAAIFFVLALGYYGPLAVPSQFIYFQF